MGETAGNRVEHGTPNGLPRGVKGVGQRYSPRMGQLEQFHNIVVPSETWRRPLKKSVAVDLETTRGESRTTVPQLIPSGFGLSSVMA